MANIGWSKPFTLENMPQVSATLGTRNLNPSPIKIGQALNGSLYLLIESRPTTTRVKLAIGAV